MHVESNMKIMKNFVENLTSFEELKEDYLKDPKVFRDEIDDCYKKTGSKLGKINFINDNMTFNIIKENCSNERFYSEIEIENYPIVSGVEGNDGKMNVNIANSVTMFLKDGSHLRFLPSKNKGIVISRIYVRPENQSKGNGSKLMNNLFSIIFESLKEFPEIELECTGTVGSGSNRIYSTISSQTRFFRKFGFRVVREESEYPEHVKMKFDFAKFVENEENLKKIISK